jgi:hypothetical protein
MAHMTTDCAPQRDAEDLTTDPRNLYFAVLPSRTTKADLIDLLAPYGTVASCRVVSRARGSHASTEFNEGGSAPSHKTASGSGNNKTADSGSGSSGCSSGVNHGSGRGYGFALMHTVAEAQAAVAGLNGQVVDGVTVQVKLSASRPCVREACGATQSAAMAHHAQVSAMLAGRYQNLSVGPTSGRVMPAFPAQFTTDGPVQSVFIPFGSGSHMRPTTAYVQQQPTVTPQHYHQFRTVSPAVQPIFVGPHQPVQPHQLPFASYVTPYASAPSQVASYLHPQLQRLPQNGPSLLPSRVSTLSATPHISAFYFPSCQTTARAVLPTAGVNAWHPTLQLAALCVPFSGAPT